MIGRRTLRPSTGRGLRRNRRTFRPCRKLGPPRGSLSLFDFLLCALCYLSVSFFLGHYKLNIDPFFPHGGPLRPKQGQGHFVPIVRPPVFQPPLHALSQPREAPLCRLRIGDLVARYILQKSGVVVRGGGCTLLRMLAAGLLLSKAYTALLQVGSEGT